MSRPTYGYVPPLSRKGQGGVLIQTRTELDRNGSLISVDVIGIVKYYVDKHYGEDADGNRGIKVTVVEEVIDINVWDAEHCIQLSITQEEEDYIANILTNKFLGE